MQNNQFFNVNVMKASTILGMVSDHTFVDDYILLEDAQFGKLLTGYVNDNAPIARAVVELTNYVNENF
jgi:hypothetical protein